MKTKKVTLFNQVAGPLFIDIVNEFCMTYDEVILVTGRIESVSVVLNPKVEILLITEYERSTHYRRLKSWLSFYIKAYAFIIRTHNLGYIILTTNPPFLPFLGRLIEKRNYVRYCVLIYDIYPDVLLKFRFITSKSFLFRLWLARNKRVYQSAESIITISHVMKDNLSRIIDSQKIRVIPPWVNTEFIHPIPKGNNWFIKKHGLEGKKIVLYSGNMGFTHDLQTFMLAAKELNGMSTNMHFVLIGGGVQFETLNRFKRDNELSNVTILPYQDSDTLPYSFGAADYGVVTLGSGAEFLSVPSKTFYYLAAGAAIIAISEKGSEIDKLVVNNSCGLSFRPNDYVSVVNFLLNTSKSELSRFQKNSRNLSKQYTEKNAKHFIPRSCA